eukprot:997349-Prymnesium_polylepis.1
MRSCSPGAPVRKRRRLMGSRRAEQACPRAAAQRESEGRPPRHAAKGREERRARLKRVSPLAPSLVDQVVNHVIAVGRAGGGGGGGPLAPSRRARPS